MTDWLKRNPLLVALALVLVVALREPQVGIESPTTEAGLRVLLVEDVTERVRLPAGQIEQLTSDGEGSLIGYLKANAKEWALIDQGDSVELASKSIQELAAHPREGVPWIVAGNGRRGYAGPLGETSAETIKKLKGL
jgi:hypothetical protein